MPPPGVMSVSVRTHPSGHQDRRTPVHLLVLCSFNGNPKMRLRGLEESTSRFYPHSRVVADVPARLPFDQFAKNRREQNTGYS